MIHVVFNEADVQVLAAAAGLEESMQGRILLVRDDFAVGPLSGLDTEEGREARREWWRQVLEGGDYDGMAEAGLVNDEAVLEEIKTLLDQDPKELVWIWAAQNKHDVCGYYWLMSRLKDYQGRIFILYLNNLPFLNEKGQLFYPEWLHVIPPREFLKARKLARPITPSEFEVDPDEWNRICEEGKGVRLLEGGKKLVQADYDFFDADLRRFITADWQKASRIIHQFQQKNKHTTGDAFLLWRLKSLLGQGDLDVQGEVRQMKEFEIKQKTTAGEPAES